MRWWPVSPEYLAKVRRDFIILDALPASVRALVHEHGAKKVVTLHMRGFSAERIAQHFEDSEIFDLS